MSEMTTSQRDKLMSDLKVVVSDAEELLKLTASDMSESTASLRLRLQERLSASKHRMLELQAASIDKAKAAGQAADDYVHEHPWKSVAIGAGVGMIVGLLIGRR